MPLTQLLRLWAPNVLDAADATRPDGPQAFWNIVTQLDGSIAKAAEEHVRKSLQLAGKDGEPPPDPYARGAS